MHPLTRLYSTLGLLALALVFMASPTYAADASGPAPSALLDTASWALLAAFLTPLATSVIQQPTWGPRLRTAVAVAVSIVVAVVTLLANGAFNDGPQTVLSILALVVTVSATTYRTIYKPAGIAGAIEGATSKTPVVASQSMELRGDGTGTWPAQQNGNSQSHG